MTYLEKFIFSHIYNQYDTTLSLVVKQKGKIVRTKLYDL